MTWTDDQNKREAVNEHGYRIDWAQNKHGLWYNARSPSGAYVEGGAGYNRAKVEAACEAHRAKLAKQKAMAAARRASKEVA